MGQEQCPRCGKVLMWGVGLCEACLRRQAEEDELREQQKRDLQDARMDRERQAAEQAYARAEQFARDEEEQEARGQQQLAAKKRKAIKRLFTLADDLEAMPAEVQGDRQKELDVLATLANAFQQINAAKWFEFEEAVP